MKYIFLHSHYGSPYETLANSLKKSPGVWSGRTKTTYSHPTDLIRLEKIDRHSVKFVDTILENQEIQSSSIEKSVLNIFLMGNPGGTEDYLRFRLRRMYEIWRRNGGIVIGPGLNGWEELENIFGIKIDKFELNSNQIIDKYLTKFSLHIK